MIRVTHLFLQELSRILAAASAAVLARAKVVILLCRADNADVLQFLRKPDSKGAATAWFRAMIQAVLRFPDGAGNPIRHFAVRATGCGESREC